MKDGFFVRLLSFIVGHDVGSSNKNARTLKSVQKQLNKTGYKFFNLKKDFITAHFAKFAYQIYAAVAPLREFFLQNTQDDFYAAQLLNFSLDSEQLEVVAKLSPENIQSLASGMELKALAEQGSKFFVALREGVEKGHAEEVNRNYNALLVFKQFCLIDYYAGLRKFHGVFRENSFEDLPHFDAVPSAFVKDFAIDVVNSVLLLLCVDDWTGVFAFVKKLSGADEQVFQRVKEQFELFKSMEAKNVFEYALRLLNGDPEASRPEYKSSRDIVRPYMEGVYQDFRSTLEDIHHKRIVENQKKLVDNVFVGRSLVPLKFYTEQENTKYREAYVHCFEHCNALMYLYSFFAVFFREEFTKFTETFEIVATSNRQSYVSDFSKLYHELDDLHSSIVELDTKLDTKFAEGYKLNSLFMRLGVNEVAVSNFNLEMDALNMKVRALIERALKTLQKILVYYEEMVEERSRGAYDVISNWEDINNRFEGGVLPLLKRTRNHISTFLVLMKDFKQLE